MPGTVRYYRRLQSAACLRLRVFNVKRSTRGRVSCKPEKEVEFTWRRLPLPVTTPLLHSPTTIFQTSVPVRAPVTQDSLTKGGLQNFCFDFPFFSRNESTVRQTIIGRLRACASEWMPRGVDCSSATRAQSRGKARKLSTLAAAAQ